MAKLENPELNGKSNQKTEEQKGKGDKKKYSFRLSEFLDLPKMGDVSIMKLSELAADAGKMLALAYNDLVGVNIDLFPNGQGFQTKLYFSKIAESHNCPNAFKDYEAATTGNKVIDSINEMSSRKGRKLYYPTDELKDGMYKLMYGYNKNIDSNKYDWNKYIYEESRPNGVYAVLSNVDIIKLLPEIYGFKDENGDDIFYQINIVRALNGGFYNGMQVATDYLIMITAVGRNAVNEAATKAGIINPVNDNFVRVPR